MFRYEPELGHAEKDVTQYSAAELGQFKQIFARRQKRRWWYVPLCYIALLPALALGVSIGIGLAEWLTGGVEVGPWLLLVMLPVLIAVNVGFKRLTHRRCPSCLVDVDHTIGPFCPCCGSKALNHYGKDPTCSACHMTLKWNQWIKSHPREFKLHACSVCGVWLQDRDG